jgi:hypothetical protein
MRTTLLICFGWLCVACNNPDARGPTTAPSARPAATATPASATAAPPSAPEPDPITHPCVVAAAQYDKAIDEGSDACHTDADCGCYQGGIGKSGCGGVLNKESVEKLGEIAKRFHDMKCQKPTSCGPWLCQPKCESGHCRR